MEGLISAGLTKSIGVSNFNKRQLDRILKMCTIKPVVNQVEVNVHFLNTKLIDYCHSKDIIVEGYSPFGSPGFLGYVHSCVYSHRFGHALMDLVRQLFIPPHSTVTRKSPHCSCRWLWRSRSITIGLQPKCFFVMQCREDWWFSLKVSHRNV